MVDMLGYLALRIPTALANRIQTRYTAVARRAKSEAVPDSGLSSTNFIRALLSVAISKVTDEELLAALASNSLHRGRPRAKQG